MYHKGKRKHIRNARKLTDFSDLSISLLQNVEAFGGLPCAGSDHQLPMCPCMVRGRNSC